MRAKARCHAVARQRITCNARGALITYQASFVGLDKNESDLERSLSFLVETTGIEPVTSCMSSKHSNQLSYASVPD